MAEVQQTRSGRKFKWQSGKTDLIRVPKVFREQILAFTKQLDLGNVPPPPTVREVQRQQLTEMDRYEILIYLKENFDQFVPSRDLVEQLAQSQAKLREQAERISVLEREQKQLTAYKSEVENLKVELQSKNSELTLLTRRHHRLSAEVKTLREQKADLIVYGSAASKSDLLITEILKLLQNKFTGTVRIYVNAIFHLMGGGENERVELCLAIMDELTEKNIIYNNCCRDTAVAAIKGRVRSFEEAMNWVDREYRLRKERNSSKD